MSVSGIASVDDEYADLPKVLLADWCGLIVMMSIRDGLGLDEGEVAPRLMEKGG